MTEEREEKPEPDASHDAEPESDEDGGGTSPFGWVSLLIIAALIVGTWFLITRLSDDGKMQDCVQSGRRNCAPIEDTGK